MSESMPLSRELTRDEITLAYHLFLGRAPSAGEVDRLSERGTELTRLRQVFLASPEFSQQIQETLPHHNVRIERKLQPAQAKRYVHMHIPKTAGTTMSAILAAAIGHDKSITVSENANGPLGGRDLEGLLDYTFIFGHLSYKAMHFFPPDSLAICVLRRPGDRLLSFFRYVSRTEDHPMHPIVTSQKMNFGDFLEYIDSDPRHQRGSNNVQMRIISGLTEAKHLGNEIHIFYVALSNLLSGRMLFGLTERFDAFQRYLMHKGLIKKISSARLNASAAPAKVIETVDTLTLAQREIFDRYTVWDNLLYDICHQISLDQETISNAPEPNG